ncbi:MAG: NAD-dependent succinate-semialdehyde dehydrogenase [Phycisphaerales bacterium JB037]
METRNLIDNQWIASEDQLSVFNPATDEPIATVPGGKGDERARAAIDAAWLARQAWAARPASERGALIARLAEFMHRDADRLARLMTREQGKPLAEARGEINYAASFLDWAAAEATRVRGEIIPASSTDKRILVLRQPVGVCAIITPWNFPAAMITRKLGPALASGCTAVIKPAEDTPLSAIAIAQLALEAGFPPGVVNLVTGDAQTIGDTLLADPRVRKLSFTGSTEVGRLLMKKAADNIMRLSLELGGHAPFIVFDDADLDRAVTAAAACKFRNAGQTCICANRFFVHERIHDDFVARFTSAMNRHRVGDGLDEGVTIGPLINDDAIDKVEAHVEDARARGATLVTGGSRVRLERHADRFYAPTLLTGMTPDMRLANEETFGPVAAVASFSSEAEVIERANNTPYGLAAYFFTRDASRLFRVAEALEYGIVGANDALPSTAQAPFGGFKHSGIGREGGHFAMDEYTEIKYVSWGL